MFTSIPIINTAVQVFQVGEWLLYGKFIYDAVWIRSPWTEW
jgi:hypothetical protein